MEKDAPTKSITGTTDLAESNKKKRNLGIYGSVATALVFGAIGVSALLLSHAAPTTYGITQLKTGQTLSAGQTLASSTTNPAYRLVMQGDGNLVVYNRAGHATWNTHTAHTGSRNRLVLQGDGNLVLYNSKGKAIWSSKTQNLGFSEPAIFSNYDPKAPGHSYSLINERLNMQTDGNLVVYAQNKKAANGFYAVWSIRTNVVWPGATGNLPELPTGQTLYEGEWMGTLSESPSPYELKLQSDGNLVLYNRSGNAMWNTHTAHTGRYNRLVMQGDGNLVLYNSTGKAIWSSGTKGSGVWFYMANDGELRLANSNDIIWRI